MSIMFSSTAIYLTVAVLSLFFIYYLYLAIRLYLHGEWQWFCLPFIALLAFLVVEGVRSMILLIIPSDNESSLVISFSTALIVVSLLSGFAVYRVMNKYRQQTIFIHLYAFFYFLSAIVVTGLLFNRLLGIQMLRITKNTTIFDFFFGMATLLPVYGIFVLILGIFILDYRLRHFKVEDR